MSLIAALAVLGLFFGLPILYTELWRLLRRRR